jgi:uncharacterized membrane protein
VNGDARADPVLRRASIVAAAGTAGLSTALVAGASWSVAVLAAWDAGAVVFVLWVWVGIARLNASVTARLAYHEDDSQTADEVVLVNAGIASLVAVGFTLAQAGHTHNPARAALTGLAVGSVLLAWAAVHTVFTLRYARLYYASPVGGIDFHQDEPPDYVDLAYVALTIGMCFQVSDTDLSKKRIRRTAMHHALISYLFGTVILAITVNSVAALLGK